MSSLHNILYFQEDPQEVASVKAVLKEARIPFDLTWVNSSQAFQSALEGGWTYDLILAGPLPSGQPAVEALAMARQCVPELPLLFLYREISEEAVLECLTAGATDCLPMGGSFRLAHALRRALKDSAMTQALRDAEYSAARSVSLLRATLESTSEGILVVDLAGKVSTYNRRFMTLCGIPSEVMSPMQLEQVLTFLMGQFKDPEAFLSETRLLGQPDRESTGLLNAKSGQVLESHTRPHQIGGKAEGRVFSFRDVTERENATDRLNQLVDVRRREDFSTLALGAVRIFGERFQKLRNRLELLQGSRPLSVAQHRHLSAANQIMTGLEVILSQLSGPADSEAAQPLPLQISEWLDRFRVRAEAILPQDIQLEVGFGPELAPVPVNPAHLEQIVMSLLLNAKEALPGAGQIHIQAGSLTRQQGLFIEVQDSGPRMPAHVREHLFEPFFTTKKEAAGLGLWAAQTIAARYGGSIRLKEPTDLGTCLRLEVPLDGPSRVKRAQEAKG